MANTPFNYANTHHESLDALLTYVSKAPTWSDPASRNEDSDWNGNISMQGAAEMARNGWLAGRDKLDDIRSSLAAQARFASVPTLTMAVAGAFPIPALAAAGEPACMVDLQPVEDRKRPIVRLAVQSSASARYSAAEITNYGAALSGIVDGLESANYRVEIVAGKFSLGVGSAVYRSQTVTLKRAEDAPEIGRLAYCLTHASFLRRLLFAAYEQEKAWEKDFAGHYGRPMTPNDTGKGWLDDDQIFLPGVNTFQPGSDQLRSPKAALTALTPIIEAKLLDRGAKLPALWLGAFSTPQSE